MFHQGVEHGYGRELVFKHKKLDTDNFLAKSQSFSKNSLQKSLSQLLNVNLKKSEVFDEGYD
jgi:hypothetical protein